ncbi:MAG: haloacid dehalogenase type II [Curvibacter lanceolatus]|uniref:haloacid dehalogenase type II n=1 Tax=Curvibacter lanceolatus TaxID=86182 RepID=UPI002354A7B4|nr:haloacid dehalogenase type II [Curvibacter lanceolatus]MBV5296131.1 haloacid dehalogenase type II [Curvibacter lanceolatus]
MDKRRASPAPAFGPPKAVLFDAFGTLFDVYSVSLLAEQLYAGKGDALSRLWRDKQIEYTQLLTCDGGAHYQPFWALTQAALRYAAAHLGLTLSEAQELRLMNQYRALSAFPENREVLQALKTQGVVTGILSNGDPEMLAVAVRSAGLASCLDHIISVDAVRRYKPHPDAYALGPKATGVAARDTLFVSGNSWDALGATWFGYNTLWVNRHDRPAEQIGPPPTRTGTSLQAVLSFFPSG